MSRNVSSGLLIVSVAPVYVPCGAFTRVKGSNLADMWLSSNRFELSAICRLPADVVTVIGLPIVTSKVTMRSAAASPILICVVVLLVGGGGGGFELEPPPQAVERARAINVINENGVVR